MASDVAGGEPAVPVDAIVAEAPPGAATPPPERSLLPALHRRRFLVVYAILAVVLGASAAGIVIAANVGQSPAARAWSKWKPTGGGLGAAQQIAAHVGAQYRVSSLSNPAGFQLVNVIAKAPAVAVEGHKIPLAYLAVRGAHGKADAVTTLTSSNSVMYTLCGLGESCTIAVGTASVPRGRVVLREIIELALYTFHYEHGIASVIALMPPRSANSASVVVYLKRSDLADELRLPLNRTLSPTPPRPAAMSPSEIELVDSVTGDHVYSFSLARAQDGNAVLVLAPIAA